MTDPATITKDEARRLIAAHKMAFYTKQDHKAAFRVLLRMNETLDRTADGDVQRLIGRYLDRHMNAHDDGKRR